jgi:stage II sporulation protein AA (anti-sigma F factor antagonist)
MIRNNYGFETRSREGLLCVYLYGEIDHHGAVALREDLDRLLWRERPRRLVLNLSRIEFMDSAGLGLLMGRYRLMRELGGVMALSSPNPRVLKILRLAGMERFFEIEQAAKGERI